MSTLVRSALALGLVLILSAAPAHATVFCVDTPDELQDALSTAASNGVNDVVKIKSGTYAGGSGVAFAYGNFNDNTSLDLSGGWYDLIMVGACVLQLGDPTDTVLSGSDVRPVLQLGGGPGTSGAITLSNLTVRDGLSAGRAGGLSMGQNAGYAGNLTVDRVYFDANVATTFGGGASISTAGTITVRNSWFRGNRCGSNTCAMELVASYVNQTTVRVFVGNNTIGANQCSANALAFCDNGGISVGGTARAALFNNAFSLNDDYDLAISNGSVVDLLNNNIAQVSGTPTTQGGNINAANPGFVNVLASNYRLRMDSPLRNAGTAGYFLGTVDFDGFERINDGKVDIGAYENREVVFRDSLEATP